MTQSVSDLMRPCGPEILRTSTVRETALTMLSEHVTELPVTDANRKLLGVVHSKDLFGARENTISSIIKKARLTVPSGASFFEVARMMHKVRGKQAIVIDGGQVVGILAWRDVVERMAN